MVHTHAETYIQRRHTHRGTHILKRYIHEKPNIRRVIYIEGLTERGYMHKRTNIQR